MIVLLDWIDSYMNRISKYLRDVSCLLFVFSIILIKSLEFSPSSLDLQGSASLSIVLRMSVEGERIKSQPRGPRVQTREDQLKVLQFSTSSLVQTADPLQLQADSVILILPSNMARASCTAEVLSYVCVCVSYMCVCVCVITAQNNPMR